MTDRRIDRIIIHCSASPNFRHVSIDEIDQWHKKRGFVRPNPVGHQRLKHVGYHYVIHLDGGIHGGRDLCEVGAHCAGHNAHSVGICMIGTDQFTADQWDSLAQLVNGLAQVYPIKKVLGHHDYNPNKTCPCFDVEKWWAENRLRDFTKSKIGA
jgi:hypothetical protein